MLGHFHFLGGFNTIVEITARLRLLDIVHQGAKIPETTRPMNSFRLMTKASLLHVQIQFFTRHKHNH